MKWHFYFLNVCALIVTGCSDSEHTLPGYIEGQYTYISSAVSGELFNVAVERGQTVKKGDLLYALDPEPEQARVTEAQSKIAELQSQVEYFSEKLNRQKKLYPKDFTAKEDLDLAQSEYTTKIQQIISAKAQLVAAQWDLQQKTISSPVSGYVFDVFYRIGERVPENRPVLAVLAPVNIRVLFYIPETQLSEIKLGQTVSFSCDGCKAETKAVVTYISPEAEFTPPVIYSKDTRYKLVYLIRASMPAEVAKQFHPGQPIYVNWRS